MNGRILKNPEVFTQRRNVAKKEGSFFHLLCALAPWRKVCVFVACLVVLNTAVHAQDLADLAPPQTQTILRINGLGSLKNDPLFKALRENAPPNPAAEQAWNQLCQQLGLSGDEIINRYFAQSVAAIGLTQEGRRLNVILTRVAKADFELAAQRLGLAATDQIGPASLYKTGDDIGRIAYHEPWLVIGDAASRPLIRMTLERLQNSGPCLSQDAVYQSWIRRISTDDQVTFFSRQPQEGEKGEEGKEGEYHAASLQLNQGNLRIHYAGTSRPIRELLPWVEPQAMAGFQHLPPSTLAAVALHAFNPTPSQRVAQRIAPWLAPQTLAGDVMPKLSAPWVIFLGQSPVVEPQPSTLPALGLSLTMKDPAVAAQLDRIVQGIVQTAQNILARGGEEKIAIEPASHNGHDFQIAQVGRFLARRWENPAWTACLQLAFGRIGDRYIVCTQAEFFRQCVDQAGKPGGFADLPEFQGLHEPSDTPVVMQARLRPAILAQRWPTWAQQSPWKGRPNRNPPLAGGLASLLQTLRDYPALSLRLTRDTHDPHSLRGEVVMKRP